MRKLTSLFLATSLAFGAASVVHAQADNLTPPPAAAKEGKPHHPPRPHHPGMMMLGGVKLTDAQKQQVRSIMEQSHKDMKRPSLEERRELQSVIASNSFDRSKAEALAQRMTANDKERTLHMMETQNKIYNVLTPEQKKQVQADFEKHLTEKPEAPKPPKGE